MDFVALPKIELHAHLTGSISRDALHAVWAWKSASGSEASTELEDPLTAMPEGQDYDINTFFPLFSSYIYNLLTDADSIASTTLSVLEAFRADGVVYLELRTTPRSSPSLSASSYVDLILRTISDFEEASRRGMPSPVAASATAVASVPPATMHTRLILSIDRRHPPAQALATVALAKRFQPRGVVGIDLCGNPTAKPGGQVREFTPAIDEARRAGLGVTVHCGETVANGEPEEMDVVLGWAPQRLGHVCYLRDRAREEVARLGRGMGLELCVSCNVRAKMVEGGYGEHHFGEWWARGGKGPCVTLGTDDVGVFGSPLSNEYRLVAEHFNLEREEVGRLARDGIDCIFGGEEEKQRLRQVFSDWEKGIPRE